MQINKFVLSTSIAALIAIVGLTTSALACHPEGAIVKKVQNVTSGSALSDANSAAQAVAAKPGDTLKYVIAITNNGVAKSNGDDDMAKTVLTDTLPTGVSLISSPVERSITETIGTIKPGQTVTKEYLVKVTAATDKSIITNTACYTGNSIVNDNPQKGCDTAVVQVSVPPVVTPPVTTPTPTPVVPVVVTSVDTTPVETAPTELPHTGPAETILGTTLAIGVAYFAVHQYIISRRALSSELRTQR